MNKATRNKIQTYFSTTVFILVILTIPYELLIRKSFGDWPPWMIFFLFVGAFVLGLMAIWAVVGFQVVNPHCPHHIVNDACWLLFILFYSLEILGLGGYWFGEGCLPIVLYGILGALLGTHLVYKKNFNQGPEYKRS